MNKKKKSLFFSDGTEEDIGANNIKLQMDVFVNQLPTCVNREMIDRVYFLLISFLFFCLKIFF